MQVDCDSDDEHDDSDDEEEPKPELQETPAPRGGALMLPLSSTQMLLLSGSDHDDVEDMSMPWVLELLI